MYFWDWIQTQELYQLKKLISIDIVCSWVDGFSTMYVGSDGKIFKHVADKVMPDQNFEEREKSKIISPLHAVPKMALFVGLSSDISSVILT